MKIALVGYGKMGKEIEKIAIANGDEVSLKITSKNLNDLNAANLKEVDVVIEFSTPETAYKNIYFCLNNNTPVISGTTGWLDKKTEVETLATSSGVGFLYASNFSIGVNIFFEINKKVAQLMNKHATYKIDISETHHTSKKDAPSGTAITTAKGIINRHEAYNHWNLTPNEASSDSLPITSHRIENVPGTHIVKYTNEVDEIALSHTAFSRKGFALGAYLSAQWIIGKKGVCQIQEVSGI